MEALANLLLDLFPRARWALRAAWWLKSHAPIPRDKRRG